MLTPRNYASIPASMICAWVNLMASRCRTRFRTTERSGGGRREFISVHLLLATGMLLAGGRIMSTNEGSGKPPSRVVFLPGIASAEAVGMLTVRVTCPFAREWFANALHEARTGKDHNARRREVEASI